MTVDIKKHEMLAQVIENRMRFLLFMFLADKGYLPKQRPTGSP